MSADELAARLGLAEREHRPVSTSWPAEIVC
jgi:hypothetical protein